MGLPLEQWRGGEAADGDGGKQAEGSGCRTPSGSKARAATDGGCPAPPRKRRAAPGAVSQQGGRGFYAGADVEAFFAANNL